MSMSMTIINAESIKEQYSMASSIGRFLEVDVTDYLEYECADEVPEWQWIEKVASFTHNDNYTDGIWEFMVNVTRLEQGDVEVPTALLKPLQAAIAGGCQYILFHQGT